ncbi:Glyoxylase I 4 [Ancistrocladus abbreviatus]
MENPLRITSVNHISIVCRSVQKSRDFYQNLLGFIPIRRPRSFDFDGAWLFNYGMGIHLLQSEDTDSTGAPTSEINPKDNHISFQCESVANVEKKLKEMKIKYAKGRVVEGGIVVDQLFFHDPDGLMIEICDCDNLPRDPTRRRDQPIMPQHQLRHAAAAAAEDHSTIISHQLPKVSCRGQFEISTGA